MQKTTTLMALLLLMNASIAARAELNQESPDPATRTEANISVAEAYLAAYSSFNPEKMAPFLTEDAIFEDLTSTVQNASGGQFVFSGKQAILLGLGEYAAQYRDFTVKYDYERRYESNGLVVFIAQLTYDLNTRDGQAFSGKAPIVTVITVRDGKVAKHADYYDYNGNAVHFQEE